MRRSLRKVRVWVRGIAPRGAAGDSRHPAPPAKAAPASPTRDAIIASPSPIERELRSLFGTDEAITIFDIGSCEGEDAIRYARLFPNAHVFAVEPVPSNVARLREHLARHGQEDAVTVLPLALSDHDGTAVLYLSSGQPDDRPIPEDWDYGNKSSSLLPPDRHQDLFPWIRFDRTLDVPTERLDGLCARLGVPAVDFIHLDVQGAELAVLGGAGALLGQVRAVWMEVEAIPLYSGQPLKSEVEDFMAQHGFAVAKDTVGSVSGDQLYVNLRARSSGGSAGIRASEASG